MGGVGIVGVWARVRCPLGGLVGEVGWAGPAEPACS